MDFNKKYLKYKQKYIDLKNQMYGSGETHTVSMCQICPTKEKVIEDLEEIIRQVPENCIKYTFIPDELHERFKRVDFDEHSEIFYQIIKDYENFLAGVFFGGNEVYMNTQARKIITDYSKILNYNQASTTWHQDTEHPETTFYNILYYLKLENCRHDCGTDIAFKNLDSQIINIKLPIIEGLIVAIKDDCFVHKSPVISLIDHEKTGMRLIIRSYAAYETSAEILDKNTKLAILESELNLEKLRSCLEDYISSSDISKKKDCLLFINHFYKKRNPEVVKIFNEIKTNIAYNSLFKELEQN